MHVEQGNYPTRTVNALDMTDEQLMTLSWARLLGLTQENTPVNDLADGGAQLIRRLGREFVSEHYPNGLQFQLNRADNEELTALLSNQILAETIAYAATLTEPGKKKWGEKEWEMVELQYQKLNLQDSQNT